MTRPLVRKYTGADIPDDALTAARAHSGPLTMTAAAADARQALASTESDLAYVVEAIGEHLIAVRRTLAAAVGEAGPSINPVGVLQAPRPRLDALISQRAAQVHHLRDLVRI